MSHLEEAGVIAPTDSVAPFSVRYKTSQFSTAAGLSTAHRVGALVPAAGGRADFCEGSR